MYKIISDYLDSVCESVRGRELKKAVRAELASHLRERSAELEKDGYDVETAAKKAVSNMGNPDELGKQITRANRARRDIAAVVCGVILAVFGLFFTISLSSQLAAFVDYSSLLMCLILPSAFALLSAGRGLTLKKFLHQFKTGAIFSGIFISVVSIIIMLRNLSDLSQLGISISVALLSIFYGLIFAAVAYAAERWCEPPDIIPFIKN